MVAPKIVDIPFVLGKQIRGWAYSHFKAAAYSVTDCLSLAESS